MKLLLVIFIFWATAASEDLFSIPLVRQNSVFEQMLELNTHPKYLKKLFGREKENLFDVTPSPKPPVKNNTVQLFKYLQSQFYGIVQIGHPGVPFKMVFDTSYFHSWVPSVLCSPFSNPPCALKKKYDSAKSTTYQAIGINYTINTEKGRLFGFVSEDKFHVGQINILNQTFVEIEEMSIMQMLYTGFDGVVGLGIYNDPNTKIISFFQNFARQFPQIPPIFSFYINRDETTVKGGSLFFGGSDKKHYNGSFTYLPVTSLLNWEIKMDKIEINYILPYKNQTAKVCEKGCNAYISTADVVIYGPLNEIKIINRLLNAHYVPYLNRFEVSCNTINKLPRISFYLGGKAFVIQGRDYVQQVKYGFITICLSAFAELKGYPPNTWGLGLSFIGRYYMELNLLKRTVGFAKSNEL